MQLVFIKQMCWTGLQALPSLRKFEYVLTPSTEISFVQSSAPVFRESRKFLTGIKAYKNSTSCKDLTDLILFDLISGTDLLEDLWIAKSSSSEPGHMKSILPEWGLHRHFCFIGHFSIGRCIYGAHIHHSPVTAMLIILHSTTH